MFVPESIHSCIIRGMTARIRIYVVSNCIKHWHLKKQISVYLHKTGCCLSHLTDEKIEAGLWVVKPDHKSCLPFLNSVCFALNHTASVTSLQGNINHELLIAFNIILAFWNNTLRNKVYIWKRTAGRNNCDNKEHLLFVEKHTVYWILISGDLWTVIWHHPYYPLVTDVETCHDRLNDSLTQLAYDIYDIYDNICKYRWYLQHMTLHRFRHHRETLLAVHNDWGFSKYNTISSLAVIVLSWRTGGCIRDRQYKNSG